MIMTNTGYSVPNQFQEFPVKRPSLVTNPQSIQQLQELYRAHSSSANDLSSYNYQSGANPTYNPIMSPTSGQYYDDQTYENYRQDYARMSSSNYQQQQNEQQLLLLSLANNQSQTSPIQSQLTTNLPTGSTIDDDEQHYLMLFMHIQTNVILCLIFYGK